MTEKPQPLYGEDELNEALKIVYRIRHRGDSSMTEKPQPLYGEDELNEALKVVYRIRMVHNGEFVLTSLEAADLIHRRYSTFGHHPPEDGIKS